MFVRWKYSERYRCEWDGHAWTAVLVESHRVDGKPRQRYVSALGTIEFRPKLNRRFHDWCFAIDGGWSKREAVIAFWDRVGERLDRVDIDPKARRRIEAQIKVKVLKPTKAQRQQETRRVKRFRAAFVKGW